MTAEATFDAVPAEQAAERVACPDCGLIQRLPFKHDHQVFECRRCDCVLAGPTTGRVDLPFALASCSLLLLIPAATVPVLSVSSLGATRTSWLGTGIRVLHSEGFPELATLVFLCTVLFPFIYLSMLVWVLGYLHFARDRAPESPYLGRIYRWVRALRPWMMMEVFLIGAFVAYTRIEVVAAVHIGLGGWCLIASTFALLLALTQLDDRTVWEALGTGPSRENGAMIACTTCDLIAPADAENAPCPRCRAPLHARKPDALNRTAAFLIAGYLLYVPANLLPVLTIVQAGREEENTILSGVFELIRSDLWPLALIVFIASIVLPLIKLFSLTWMLLSIHLRSVRALRARTKLFRAVDVIGRWSNIDVFMGSMLVALLRFGTLTSVRVDAGMVAFAAVVVATMIAVEMFDTRLMWDAAEGAP